jgi:RNA polymerase sigma factor (sigma-70 family)
LTMKIYEKLMDELPKRQIRNFSGWLYVLTRNECLMQLRKTANSNEVQDFPLVGAEFVENEQSMHHIKEEKLKMLEKCIERLKDEQKKCVDRFFLKSKSYREIANELNIHEKKVKSYIQNGKRNLKICIEQSEK